MAQLYGLLEAVLPRDAEEDRGQTYLKNLKVRSSLSLSPFLPLCPPLSLPRDVSVRVWGFSVCGLCSPLLPENAHGLSGSCIQPACRPLLLPASPGG